MLTANATAFAPWPALVMLTVVLSMTHLPTQPLSVASSFFKTCGVWKCSVNMLVKIMLQDVCKVLGVKQQQTQTQKCSLGDRYKICQLTIASHAARARLNRMIAARA